MNTTYYTYRIPFEIPFKTSKQTFNERKGVLIKLDTKSGTVYSEAAPLPGYSEESFDNVISWLKNHGDVDLSHGMISVRKNAEILPPPSLQFAIDALFWQRVALEQEKPLHAVLFETAAEPISIPLNGTIGLSSPTKALEQAGESVSSGYETLKVKISPNIQQSIEIISEIRSNYPHIKLRVDANRSLNLAEAKTVITELEPLHIDYIEEPLQADEQQYLEILKDNTSIKLAADESVRTVDAVKRIAEENLFDTLILKPMLLGSFQNLFSIIRLVLRNNLDVVLTSSLESAVGRLITAHLAVGLSEYKSTAQGLSTGHLLQTDFIDEDQYTTNGSLNLTAEPGLGEQIEIENTNVELNELTL